MQSQFITLILLIVFVLIDAINSVDRIDRINRIDHIDPGVINNSALQLKDNSNYPINYGMTFWGKKGENIKVTGIYWHLKKIHEVCLRNK